MNNIVFASNFYNHHQSSFSEKMYQLTDGGYRFIETEQMDDERKSLGWGVNDYPEFVLRPSSGAEEQLYYQTLINDADTVILGSAPDKLLIPRLKRRKLTFRYSERMFKVMCPKWQIPLRIIKNYFRFGRWDREYLLCAGAYTAADFKIVHTFAGKAYKWGYFPEAENYDLNELSSRKAANKMPVLLWVGRLIEWKHPEAAVSVAKRLKADNYDFELNIIGSGEMDEHLKAMIANEQLEDRVHVLGAMKPGQVREYMEQANIFLFTSDFQEGWGAVLNESMNSGCAVVASHAIGSVPFLIKDGENGLIYKSGDIDSLYKKVKYLLDEPGVWEALGHKAYETIISTWNADEAARRFMVLAEELNAHGSCDLFPDGPCSRAKLLENDWY